MGIPWWVWLLAALGGCLLLALITYCLYKVAELLHMCIFHCTHNMCTIYTIQTETMMLIPFSAVWLLQEAKTRGWP